MPTLGEFEEGLLDDIRKTVASPLLVDLGCGIVGLREGWIGVDAKVPPDTDRVIVADLFSGAWPFDDASVDMFASNHFLEHVPDWNHHFVEAYRCLKPGGIYRIIGPHAGSDRATQDPEHRQMLTEDRFLYIDQRWLRANRIAHDHPRVHFERVFTGYVWHPQFANVAPEAQQYALKHFRNAANDIVVVLRKEAIP
ncbi:MAG: methyltransferase domain-containing protein [Thermoanaerobaculia bacterium]|jgi:predicted SAM-dependent methyltransferase